MIAGTDGHWYWTWRGPAAMSILAGSCVVGFVLACIALARSEKLRGLTTFALLLNAPLPLWLLAVGLANLLAWLRYG
jgi:hypothetical protein